MAEKKEDLTKEALLSLVKKMPCVRSVVISEGKEVEGSGWQESEEEYQKRQADWLSEVKRKSKDKKITTKDKR